MVFFFGIFGIYNLYEKFASFPGPIELVQWSMCLASVTLQNASVIGSLQSVARPGVFFPPFFASGP